jgi:hypothetical protein
MVPVVSAKVWGEATAAMDDAPGVVEHPDRTRIARTARIDPVLSFIKTPPEVMCRRLPKANDNRHTMDSRKRRRI